MVPESIRQKKYKDYNNAIHRNSTDTSSQWTHDKYDNYSSHEHKNNSNGNGRYKQRKSINELVLNVNSKTLVLNNFENMEKRNFSNRLSDYLNKLKLDEETYIITKIKVLNELSKLKSKHFDGKEYDELLSRYTDYIEKR